jgi:DNA polymerase III epsilon subunit-like protein
MPTDEQLLPDVYISVDIEADGPIPGDYSMLSFGMTVAGWYDGARLTPDDPTANTFYVELKPITDKFDPKALAVAGLDRNALQRDGEEPAAAMARAAEWVDSVSTVHVPVLVAWPAEFDWSFLHWYFIRYLGRDPFGYSSCIDTKAFYLARSGLTTRAAHEGGLPPELRSTLPHTHDALDDAMAHAERFANIFVWHKNKEK